jgi:hypothetical protein
MNINKQFKLSETIEYLKLSYSRLSDFDRNGPRALVKSSFVDNEGVRIGSLVDDLLLEPETIDDKYLQFDGNKPTATLGKLVDIILNWHSKIPSEKELVEIATINGFWKRQKTDTIINNIVKDPDFYPYLKAMFASKDKTLVTSKDLDIAEDIVNVLLTHTHSKDIFNNNLDNRYQFKFEIEYNKLTFRGLLDILQIDHKKKEIQAIDLKTGANKALEFQSSFIKWRYYLQAAIYNIALQELVKTNPELKEYKILPFKFLYISRYERLPVIYIMTPHWHQSALEGFKTSFGKSYRGLHELIEEVKWHLDNKIFDLPRKVYENNGMIDLNEI